MCEEIPMHNAWGCADRTRNYRWNKEMNGIAG